MRQMEREKVNLRILFTSPYENLPKMVDSLNCIYRITNLINHKSYIGQAKWLYGRFVNNGFSHINQLSDSDRYLYNSIRKYKSRNFEVEILEKDLDESLLNEHEIKWISYYRTFYKDGGYNLTTGGENCEHLHTKEVFDKIKRNHGGVLAINTPDARIKALETRRRNNNFNADHLHTDEMYEIQKKNHGGVLAFHTEDSRLNALITNWFNAFDHNLEKALYDYEEITGYTYFMSSTWVHLDKLMDYIEYLQDDDRWTSEHERIFQEIIKIPEMINRYGL